jgi:hypothetical protein
MPRVALPVRVALSPRSPSSCSTKALLDMDSAAAMTTACADATPQRRTACARLSGVCRLDALDHRTGQCLGPRACACSQAKHTRAARAHARTSSTVLMLTSAGSAWHTFSRNHVPTPEPAGSANAVNSSVVMMTCSEPMPNA